MLVQFEWWEESSSCGIDCDEICERLGPLQDKLDPERPCYFRDVTESISNAVVGEIPLDCS